MLELCGLAKRYGDFEAVRDITLSVRPGELYALLGPNGAGKTTTIRMLMGVLRPSGGSARVDGLDCFSERAAVMRKVGYLPDEPQFYDYLRGGELLRFVGEMHGFDAREALERAEPWIARLSLEDAIDEFAVNYSKGMKKKLALCCALLHEPELLVLDEPTNGLDPYATRTLHEIAREQAEAGRSVFFTTHLLDQAARLCHRIGILHGGRIAAQGTLAELRESSGVGAGSLEDVFFRVTGSRAETTAPAGA
ncbi:MAG: ABC transporter ATP-binding protein [Planctomycetota bacterium]|nr:MAG: ABC transporter ATP-binding protein [Planctomycetota bacterium]